ncbi:MAG TPA: SPFH domain-containing protein [Pirellulales bacterium]|nr:SPFH domain-containing protein [Pirellulales bacterium]
MNFYKTPAFWLRAIAVLIGLVILQQIWHWEVERLEVPSGKFLIRIHKWGRDLAEGQIIAPDESYKGVMLDVWPEGRHFLNPLFWSHEIDEMVSVPPGECLVLTRKFGKDIPLERIMGDGDILAAHDPQNPEQGERGIVREVLTPGSYRLNKYAYTWENRKAIEIKISQVGVRTLKVGKDPTKLKGAPGRSSYVVPAGYRGIQEEAVPPGTYYLNDYVELISPVEVRSHRVELRDITFPSRDGFILTPRVVVEYAVDPQRASEMLVRLTDEGTLHQEDSTPQQQQQNEILQKVILPHMRGYARIEGSNFDARDFILSDATVAPAASPAQPEQPANAAQPSAKRANARERMQKALLDKVKDRCQELGVEVRAVTLADLLPPKELSEQIAQRELARVEREKNLALVKQHKAQQELASKIGLKQQAKEKVEAETLLVQATTKAEQLKEVEESRLKQQLANAEVELEAARDQALAKVAKGEADAKVIALKNEAEVAGLRTAVQGFTSAEYFAQYHILQKLAPALTEIFAGDESEFARLFAGYMSRPSDAQSSSDEKVPATKPALATIPEAKVPDVKVPEVTTPQTEAPNPPAAGGNEP